MKKVLLLASGLLFLGATQLQAQNWVNKGNTLSGNGIIGINSNQSLLFETNNTERGRITNNGLWGIGTGTTLPDAKFQINSITTRDPLRVQVDTKTKFLVSKAGGVSIGANVTPPTNGLYVAGNMGIGTATPDSKLTINSATNQAPLRLEVDGLTKILAHKNGGLSIGGEHDYLPPYGLTPPEDGLFVRGKIAIGYYSLDISDSPAKLTIGKEDVDQTITTGISTIGKDYGIKAVGDFTGVLGVSSRSGVTGSGDRYGVFADSRLGTAVYGQSSEGNGGRFSSYKSDGIRASTGTDSSYAGLFEGDIFATGVYQGSDKNIKKNIKEMGNASSLISQLKPKYYQFRNDGKYASLMLPKGNHYGLLAQDVEEVLPTLVKETLHEVRDQKSMAAPKLGPDDKLDLSALNKEQASTEPTEKISIKAVNYTELIPIMIKSMQEQQTKMQEQQVKIEELTLLVQKLSQKDNSTVSIKPTDAYLSQSAPNPSKNSTRINFSIPTGSTKAQLVIMNATGQQVKKISLNNSGSVEVDTTSLSAGTYFYSLYVDDALVATEKMVVAR